MRGWVLSKYSTDENDGNDHTGTGWGREGRRGEERGGLRGAAVDWREEAEVSTTTPRSQRVWFSGFRVQGLGFRVSCSLRTCRANEFRV
jgi:hypothetical protein